jgi:uncharacterized Zn finger protein (UPF0148 family)
MRPGGRRGYQGKQQARCDACKGALKWRFTGGVFWELYCPACEAKSKGQVDEAAGSEQANEKERP